MTDYDIHNMAPSDREGLTLISEEAVNHWGGACRATEQHIAELLDKYSVSVVNFPDSIYNIYHNLS